MIPARRAHRQQRPRDPEVAARPRTAPGIRPPRPAAIFRTERAGSPAPAVRSCVLPGWRSSPAPARPKGPRPDDRRHPSGPAASGGPDRPRLRALYPGYDLHALAGTWLALPAGTPWFTAPAIGEIARQIAAREHHPPPPASRPGPGDPGPLTRDADAPPRPVPAPAAGASPAATTAALARALSARGITGIYTATAARFGLVSVTAAVTAWTNGHQIWCTCAGQHHAWPAADIQAAATALAALARPGGDP